jgi:hypothetical protein
MTMASDQSEMKTHEFEAGRIFDSQGRLLSIVKGKTVYREVTDSKEPEVRPGTYA